MPINKISINIKELYESLEDTYLKTLISTLTDVLNFSKTGYREFHLPKSQTGTAMYNPGCHIRSESEDGRFYVVPISSESHKSVAKIWEALILNLEDATTDILHVVHNVFKRDEELTSKHAGEAIKSLNSAYDKLSKVMDEHYSQLEKTLHAIYYLPDCKAYYLHGFGKPVLMEKLGNVRILLGDIIETLERYKEIANKGEKFQKQLDKPAPAAMVEEVKEDINAAEDVNDSAPLAAPVLKQSFFLSKHAQINDLHTLAATSKSRYGDILFVYTQDNKLKFNNQYLGHEEWELHDPTVANARIRGRLTGKEIKLCWFYAEDLPDRPETYRSILSRCLRTLESLGAVISKAPMIIDRLITLYDANSGNADSMYDHYTASTQEMPLSKHSAIKLSFIDFTDVIEDYIDEGNEHAHELAQTNAARGFKPSAKILAAFPDVQAIYEARKSVPYRQRPYSRHENDNEHLEELLRSVTFGVPVGEKEDELHADNWKEISGHMRRDYEHPYDKERAKQEGAEVYEPIPHVKMYHATSNLSQIIADKSLRNRALAGGMGLGGGGEYTISVTYNEQSAEIIAKDIKFLVQFLHGDIEVDDLLTQARSGVGADKPFIDDEMGRLAFEIKTGHTKPQPKIFGLSPEDVEDGWKLYEESKTENGNKLYIRELTPEDILTQRYYFFTRFLAMRDAAGGEMNPLFAFVNIDKLAQVDPNNIGVVELMPKENAYGYHKQYEKEWRTWHGDAFDIIGYKKV